MNLKYVISTVQRFKCRTTLEEQEGMTEVNSFN